MSHLIIHRLLYVIFLCLMISSLKIKSLLRAETFNRVFRTQNERSFLTFPAMGSKPDLICITFVKYYLYNDMYSDPNISIKSICSTSSTKVDFVS